MGDRPLTISPASSDGRFPIAAVFSCLSETMASPLGEASTSRSSTPGQSSRSTRTASTRPLRRSGSGPPAAVRGNGACAAQHGPSHRPRNRLESATRARRAHPGPARPRRRGRHRQGDEAAEQQDQPLAPLCGQARRAASRSLHSDRALRSGREVDSVRERNSVIASSPPAGRTWSLRLWRRARAHQEGNDARRPPGRHLLSPRSRHRRQSGRPRAALHRARSKCPFLAVSIRGDSHRAAS